MRLVITNLLKIVFGLVLVGLYFSTHLLQSHCPQIIVRQRGDDVFKGFTNATAQVSAFKNTKPILITDEPTFPTVSLPRTLPDDIQLLPWRPTSWIPRKFFTAPRFCNNYTHIYMIDNRDLCSQKNVLLVIGVRSATRDYDARSLIRNTWGSFKEFHGLSVITVFLLGKPTSSSFQAALQDENKLTNDIIQADYVDSYRNLTIKSQMIFKWMRDYCSHAQYFMITDTDLFVDMYKLTNYLSLIKSKADDSYVLCKVEWTERPYRPPQYGGHAAMPYSEYSGEHYAPYCWGGANVATLPVINKLYVASLHTPRLRIDDVWTGILAEKAGIKFPPTSDAYILPWHKRHNLLTHEKYFDGPIMFASWHGATTRRLIRSTWSRVHKFNTQMQANVRTGSSRNGDAGLYI